MKGSWEVADLRGDTITVGAGMKGSWEVVDLGGDMITSGAGMEGAWEDILDLGEGDTGFGFPGVVSNQKDKRPAITPMAKIPMISRVRDAA